uniref:Vacuolar protein sorting-associated protein 51 homolog n=1 Tax=Syphacia muris TaxID=451379 RepID=A0A0N5AFM2_9BILA
MSESKNAEKKKKFDIKSAEFDCETYLNSLLKKKSLDELVQVEEDMVQNVRRLDSEMQQLVYENYNKFITATGTVKKMQNDFSEMGREMESVLKRMEQISELSKNLCSNFETRRTKISDLSETNRTLKTLRFMLRLPAKLQSLSEKRDHARAVACFAKAKPLLLRFLHISSVLNIYDVSTRIMTQIEQQLTEVAQHQKSCTEELADSLELLLRLGVPPSNVHSQFMEICMRNLNEQIDNLDNKNNSEKEGDEKDVLEFVDDSCSAFLADLSLVAALNKRMFPTHASDEELIELFNAVVGRFGKSVRERFLCEVDARECALVVRALDRFYRRLSSCNKLVSGVDYSPLNISMLNSVSRHEIILARERIVERVNAAISQVCSELAVAESSEEEKSVDLNEMVSRLEHVLTVHLKTALASLLHFTASDMTFSSLDPSLFSHRFGIEVHEALMVESLEQVCQIGSRLRERNSQGTSFSATLYILLAQFFMNIESHSLEYMFGLCQEQFRLVEEAQKGTESCLTSIENVRFSFRNTAYELLRHYVNRQGVLISQPLVRSTEGKDWLNCPEPNSVRATMKRFLEELASLDVLIKPFMQEGARKERTGDISSLRSLTRRNPNFDACSISSTLDKLWAERVDFCANVEFNRTSVLTALVNISMKSLLESVRLQTFSTSGLHQIQIDCAFLQQRLWRFITDDQGTVSFIDEIVSSAVHRCVDPKLLGPLVVSEICSKH